MPWLPTQMALLDAARAVASFAANWLLQSTLLIAAGIAVARLARRRGSASQSAIYRTTLAAVMVCPLATSLLARGGVAGWSVELPVAWSYEESTAATSESAGQNEPTQAGPTSHISAVIEPTSLSADPNANRFALGLEPPRDRLSQSSAGASLAGQLAPSAPAPASPAISDQEPSARTFPAKSAVFEVRTFGLAAVGIALVWLAVSAVLLLRLGLAWRRLRRLRDAATAAEPAAQRACRELAAVLKVAAPEVLRTPYLASPCLAGLLRPAVLLPEADPSLPLRDVLIHELAHLRRRDAFWNLLARLAEALFFHQPLLWLLVRRLEAAAEEVCDDYVVQFGGDREQYARGLLQIAELSSPPVGAAGVAMVSLRSILARRVTRIIDSSRSRSTRAGNLLLAIVIVGGLAATAAVSFVGLGPRSSLAEAQPASDEAAKSESDREAAKAADAEDNRRAPTVAEKANKQASKAEPAAENQLHGRVIGADGKPVAGAKVYWLRSRVHDLKPEPPRLVATTGDDGRYHFAEPPAVSEKTPASWSYSDRIVIKAAGHGFVFTSSSEIRSAMSPPEGLVAALAQAVTGTQARTRLPAAGEPIRGRLVDINGQPVAGAKVRIRWFGDERDRLNNLKEAEARGAEYAVWQARVALLLNVIEPVPLRDALPSATTDAAGRFELRDIGAKRLLQLLVEGEGIESSEIVARNESGENIVIEPDRNRPRELTIYPNEFVHAVGPSKPVEGRVLDLDTGEPITGAVVRAVVVHGQRVTTSREREHFAATTDAEGRYRIAGLPIGNENKLVAFATGNVAYFPVGHTADTSAVGAAIQLDFRLKRGVWAEGRVFDAESHKPFTGEISYYFFRNRELEQAIPGLRHMFIDGLYWTNANGEFRVPVLPSRGILGFRYDGNGMDRDGIDRYARAFGADEIAGSEPFGGDKWFPTEPFYLIPANYERIAEVPATDGQETVRVDMPLFASRPVAVRVVDPQGEGVVQFQAYGANQRWGWQNQEGSEFKIQDLRPGERRKVFVFHRARNLAGGGFAQYGAEQTVEIKLVEAGSVCGRLVDADGAPIDDATLSVDLEKLRSDDNSAIWARHPDLQANPEKIPVDKEGRFRLDGLIPGWTYHAHASAPRPLQGQTVDIIIGSPLKGVQVKAGENKDLGDLVIGADKSGKPDESKKDASAQSSADAQPMRDAAAQAGRGVDAEGRQKVIIDEHGDYYLGDAIKPNALIKSLDSLIEVVRLNARASKGPLKVTVSAHPSATYTRVSQLVEKLGHEPNVTVHLEVSGKGKADFSAQPNRPDEVNDLVTVSGKVVDPQGKPFAGAKLYAVRWYWEPHIPRPPLAESTSDADGRYTISFRKFTADVGREDPWKEVAIIATADGLGAAWVTWRDIPRGEEATLRLVADDAPIAGRVVDLEGKPVAGVSVRVGSILAGKGGNLDDWLAAVRRGEFLWTTAKHLNDELPQFDGWPPRAVTGKDGRFRITGLGRERRVHLSFSSPKVAYQEIEAVTRRSDMFPLKLSDEARGWGLAGMVYGAEFELVAPPTQPITGIVRDAETRQPLAGVSIQSNTFAGNNSIYTRQLRAVSDANGRYRLVGLPKGAGNRIMAVPNDDQPYLMRDVEAPESRGLEPVQLDVELHRGIWITGRITNLRTGEPVVAQLHYLPFLSNEYAQKTPEFGKPRTPDGFDTRYISRPDGSYRLVGLPGRAIVAAECAIGQYRQGVGAEDIAGMDKHGDFDTYPNPIMPGKKWPNAMKEINPPPGTETVRCDLALDPGEKVTVNVADRDGKPVDGLEVQGSVQACYDSHELHGSFDVITLGPDETRTVIIRHKGRKLGKVIRVRLAEHPSGSLSVTVEPTARIIGRLVDRQGAPLSGAAITAWVNPKPLQGFRDTLSPATTDGDGRFEYADIPTGCQYDLHAQAAGLKQPGLFAKYVVVGPGETKDLGDVIYGGAAESNRQSSTTAKPAEKAAGNKMQEPRKLIIRGRVTRGGKPASGAHLAVMGDRTAVGRGSDLDWGHEVLGDVAADENGEYALRLKDVSQQTHHNARLVVRQDGAAIAWRRLNLNAAETELAIVLQPEEPLRGKLIDLEGQPAAGVRLSIASVIEPGEGGKGGDGVGYRPSDQVPAAWIAPITTDDQGRFVVHGIAASQGVLLEVGGDDRFAQQDIAVNTGWADERGEHDRTYRPLVKNLKPGEEAALALAPAQVFEGTVRCADSGEAVPHARISIWSSQQELGSMMSLAGNADEKGHYRISPRPGIRFGVTAYPPDGAAYLARQTPLSESIKWKASERVKQVDMTLPRGVLVRGRVVEAGSDTAVVGAAVQYMPEEANNRNATDDILTGWQAIQPTGQDGRFTIAVLPGPGRLLINSPHGNYVLQEIGGRQLSQGEPGGQRNYTHAVVKLHPQVGQDAIELKVELEPGATVKGRIVDERGKLVEEALVVSRLNISPHSLTWRGHTTPTLGGRFELSGLAKDVEYPVYFLDAKRRLGATEVIKAGDGERTVVLKPCGKAALRMIDAKGEPLGGNYANVQMVVTPGPSRFDREAARSGELMADSDFISNIDRTNNDLTSEHDEQGKVSLPALIPGATYRVLTMRGGRIQIAKEFKVESNETLDLGEIVVERDP